MSTESNNYESRKMNTAVGVDGCKAGWFCFRKDPSSISFGIASNLEELTSLLPKGSKIFIDIPIGLIDSGSDGRACDIAARKALGFPRGTSVFPAPAFSVLEAKNYEDAKRLSLKAIGKKMSKQAFNILDKIREVNNFLISNRNSGYTIREVHPEICFRALNDQQPMKNSKKRSAGFDERMIVLEKHLPNARYLTNRALKKYKRSVVAKDDIIDALVAMVVASAPDENLKTLPPSPPKDSRNLPMEMVYTEEPNNNAL